MICQETYMTTFSATPFKNIPIISDDHASGNIIGYQLVPGPSGVFCKPTPERIACHGWLAIIGLALVFWPLTCVPCCMSCSYSAYQVPVYDEKDTTI